MSWQEQYVERYYRSRPGWIDGTEQFHQLCGRHIREGSRVVEVGAGPSNSTSAFLGRHAGHLTGLDIDEAVKGNEFLDDAVVYDGRTFPFDDASFDAVVSDYAFEHVENPVGVCGEIARVLKPGGVFVFRTPSRFHYVSLLSRILPDSMSVWARNREPDHPTYAKYFRMNSRGQCRRVLGEAGLEILEMERIEKEPSYGMKSRILFYPMMAYERIVNSTEALSGMRANILCAAGKPEGGATK